MGTLLMVAGGILIAAGFGAALFVVVQAFRDEWWKGALCLASPWYLQRYAQNDFEHEHDGAILLTWKLGYLIGILLIFAGNWLANSIRW